MRAVSLRLRPLRLDDEADARRAHAELEADDFDFLLAWNPEEPWPGYVHRVNNQRLGLEVAPGWVASTFLTALSGGELVGRISVRHELNDFLLHFGGHIGYCVRPAHRRRGYASEILGQGLVVARAAGVERVLVTCDEHNE